MKKVLIGIALVALVFYFWSGKKETTPKDKNTTKEAYFKDAIKKQSQNYAEVLCDLKLIKAHEKYKQNDKQLLNDVVKLEEGLQSQKQSLNKMCEGKPGLQKTMQNIIQEKLKECGIAEEITL